MLVRYLFPTVVAVAALTQLAGAQVVGDRATTGPAISVQTPAATVNVQPRLIAPSNSATVVPPAVETNRADVNVITDNRADRWRYKWENNRWWYWTPDNRWMTYAEPSGWTYYEPSGSYTAGYGGVGVTVAPAVPATTYTPAYGYYGYGYPYNYYGGGYYGGGYYRPGVYINGGWGGVGIGFGGRGRYR